MGQQVVSEYDRLRLLQVSETRADAFDVLLGLSHQRLLQGEDFDGEGAYVIAQKQAQVVGGLVVARTAGAQLAAEGAEAFGQQAFDKGVNVFVIQRWRNTSGAEVGTDAVQGFQHGAGFLLVEQTGPLQFAGMRLGTGQIVRRQAEIALGAPGEGGQGG
ncbi:hypothetical protein D3C87_735280 [compost metagenome]